METIFSFSGYMKYNIMHLKDHLEQDEPDDASKLEKILSTDSLIKFSKGNEVLSQGQSAIIKLMRLNQGIQQNCSTEFEVLASSDAMLLAKVNFVYEGFIVENYLTLELDRTQNWKITRINKFYIDAGSAKVQTRE